ncbi:MAG: hypothetical protein CSA96_00165 [Bacteroidetes bacterium]|nr:MAG: hypothetical protein CSA96_00165 [Bacteroidota bacterium]
MKKLFVLSVLLLMLFACEVDITDEFRRQQALFVVSGRVVAGKSPRINLSKTVTMTVLDSLVLLDAATVKIERAGRDYELFSLGKGCYENELLSLAPGDDFRLSCSGEGLPEATVSSRVPGLPVVNRLDFEVDDDYHFSLELCLQDPPGSKDYYEFYLSGWRRELVHHHGTNGTESYDDTLVSCRPHMIQLLDPFIEFRDAYDGYESYELEHAYGERFVFSDARINGREHKLTVEGSLLEIYSDSIPQVYVNLVKKDVHFYNFISTYQYYDPYPEQDFFQPVQVYSNIENGFGLLIAESPHIDTIDLSEWVNDPEFLDLLPPL